MIASFSSCRCCFKIKARYVTTPTAEFWELADFVTVAFGCNFGKPSTLQLRLQIFCKITQLGYYRFYYVLPACFLCHLPKKSNVRKPRWYVNFTPYILAFLLPSHFNFWFCCLDDCAGSPIRGWSGRPGFDQTNNRWSVCYCLLLFALSAVVQGWCLNSFDTLLCDLSVLLTSAARGLHKERYGIAFDVVALCDSSGLSFSYQLCSCSHCVKHALPTTAVSPVVLLLPFLT